MSKATHDKACMGIYYPFLQVWALYSKDVAEAVLHPNLDRQKRDLMFITQNEKNIIGNDFTVAIDGNMIAMPNEWRRFEPTADQQF